MIRSRWFMRLRLHSFLLAAGLATAAGTASLTAAEGVAIPIPDGSRVDPGEILLGELHCAACHTVTETSAARLDSRAAPRLGVDGLRLTPQWLRSWLDNPSKSKPGTGMPDLLRGVPEAQRADAVESLTHFLVSIQPPGSPAGISADPARAAVGQQLYHTLGCVACHAPMERAEASADTFQRAVSNAIPLGDLGRKYPAGELARFLRDPAAHRPSGRMPALALTEAEASDLAVYLLRDQMAAAAAAEAAPVAGLKWEYFEGRVQACAELKGKSPVLSGSTDHLSTEMARRETDFGLRFTGGLQIVREGEYTFWTTSDDGSQLLVDDRMVVDNDGEHGGNTVSGKIILPPGFHSFQVLFFQSGSGYEFAVQWAGPGFDRQPLPPRVLKHFARPMVPVGHVAFAVDPDRAAKGSAWFTQLNCGACHVGSGLPTGRTAAPLKSLGTRSREGCLAESVPASAPRFTVSAAQRASLRKAIANAASLETPAAPGLQVELTLTRLNCYACHVRDGIGGPLASGHADWFRVVGDTDLGEEGRLPPLLTGVGSKLKPEWLAQVLAQGTKVRPYMATRMPVFGAPQLASLPAALRTTDRSPNAPASPPVTDRDAKFGWKLVGNDGLSCIACHTFGKYGSLGIPALELDTMGERLEWDWFRRYLPDPVALRPGTRMPTFWPDGKAVNETLLGGDTAAQIQAIWAYLAAGSKAEVPSGLVRGRQELTAQGEPVIYRNFIAGAGTRAIGVGYPEKANLAFDAAELRPALIWQGGFMDAARHSTGRGEGFEPPLGDHRISLPQGAPLAVLAEETSAWPSATGHAAGYRFAGYRLDVHRRPIFRYSFHGIDVEESYGPRPGEVDMTLVRTFRFSGRADGPVWFRAATGEVKAGPDGTWIVGEQLHLRFRGGGDARLIHGELRVPVTIPGELTEELTW